MSDELIDIMSHSITGTQEEDVDEGAVHTIDAEHQRRIEKHVNTQASNTKAPASTAYI